jgi:glycosyltransferase involved in cell wall biosynthesis
VKRPAVIIVGPPWPRSGTARVIQNQIEFYRSRGYLTVFLGVAIHRDHMKTSKIWDGITEGVQDLGADHISIAALDRKRYVAAKYTSSVRHALRGTVLDWIVDIGRSAQLPDDAVRLIEDLPVSLVHVNHVYTLGFAQRLLRQSIRSGDRVPIIVETHDVQSHLLQERGDLNPWINRPDSLKRLIRCEKALLKRAHVLVHLSVDDFKFFQTLLPSKPHILAMPTIDEAFVSAVNAASPSAIDPLDLLFVGQSHGPNLAALKWFFEQVWPLIANRRYNIKIVGAVDLFVRQSLPETYETFRSSFVGPVADLTPYYRAARCVIAPMVSGSGISIKTIEALSLGKPIVGTSKAFRGMPMDRIERAGLRVHDEPQAFADAIARVLSAEVSEGALSRAAYESIFSAQAAFAARDEAVRIATGASGDQKEGFASVIIPSS